MMQAVLRIDDTDASADEGKVVMDWSKTVWVGGLLLSTLIFVPFHTSWSSILVFTLLGYFTLLLGHSVGMHRMMIHRTFTCPKPIERVLIYIGVLVGMGGPLSIIKVHDMRDWAQRQSSCHAFFTHERGFVRDLCWQLFYRFEFERPPKITVEDRLAYDKWIQFFEHTWWMHQLVLAFILYICGGLSWVVWGVAIRVPLSIMGHWTITYLCHNPGPQKYLVDGACVQASNLPLAGFLSHGECWHNNHHAFPESARIGLEPGQIDPAWKVIECLAKIGVAHNVGIPRPIEDREDLIQIPT